MNKVYIENRIVKNSQNLLAVNVIDFLKKFIEIKNQYIVEMAGDSAVSTASKPQMRGLLNSAIKRNLTVSIILAAASGIAFQQLIAKERKRKYAEFYRTYDAEKEFEEMKKKGLFQSC